MENTRMSRSELEQENNQRIDEDFYTFEEPDALAIPQAVQDRFSDQGLVLRWIRVTLNGKDDLQNVGKRIQDGWSWVKPEEVPEMVHDSFVREEGRYSGTVSRGDLALAKAPKARMLARKEFYETRSREMMDAVNAQLQNHSDSRMPISNSSKSKVTTGRNPKFQD